MLLWRSNMSLLSSLRPKRGSTHNSKRVGRGVGSGKGGTAAKGHKGQKARTGGKVRWGFEGGQSPLMRRLPKFGFTNNSFKISYEVINLDTLNLFDKEVTPETLNKAGICGKGLIKILGRGKITKSLKIKAHKCSETALKAIQAAGGSFEVIK
jgi:large subunit ribosomal protein L15